MFNSQPYRVVCQPFGNGYFILVHGSACPPCVDGRALRYQHRKPQLLAAAAEYVLRHGRPRSVSAPCWAQGPGVTHATRSGFRRVPEEIAGEVVEHLRSGVLADTVAAVLNRTPPRPICCARSAPTR